ncbi:MAG: aldo/keto reductase, partial [Myxococcota bacterium]
MNGLITLERRIGFGVMRLTGQPGNFGPYEAWEAGVALLREAASLGVELFDSALSYGPEHADRLLGEALGDSDVMFATKGGVDKPAPGRIVVDGRRDTLHRQIDRALVNLRRDRVDLFQLHRVDPNAPIEVSVAALEEARQDGRITHIGAVPRGQEPIDEAVARPTLLGRCTSGRPGTHGAARAVTGLPAPHQQAAFRLARVAGVEDQSGARVREQSLQRRHGPPRPGRVPRTHLGRSEVVGASLVEQPMARKKDEDRVFGLGRRDVTPDRVERV